MTDPNSTLPLVQAYKEIDRLKVELAKAQAENARLSELASLKLSRNRIKELQADNAKLTAALGKKTRYQTKNMEQVTQSEMKKRIADFAAATGKIPIKTPEELIAAMRHSAHVAELELEIDRLKDELAHLRAATEGKV